MHLKTTLFTTALAILVIAASTASAQDCLHGKDETFANRTRRQQAIRLAQGINAAETLVRGVSGTYRPFEELLNVPTVPRGFDVQLHADSDYYSFSIKDTLDPCRYAVFSDQDGWVYEAVPRRQGGVVPATEEKDR